MIQKILRHLLLLTFLMLLGLGGIGYFIYQQTLQTPIQAQNNTIIHIPKGSSVTSIARILEQDYGLKNSWVVPLYARLNGSAQKIQAGYYRLEQNITIPVLLHKMIKGEVATFSFQLVEGKTAKALLEQLSNTPDITQTLQNKTPEEIAKALNINGSLEGQFLPETYHFPYKTTDLALLKRMHQALQSALSEAWSKRSNNIALKTPYEALILASIIEKETAIPSEREQVSGVFNRRLQKNMRLQTDPTVLYGLSSPKQILTKKDLQTDTPYNTYTRNGLPPTPIALPSKASIQAAVNPDNSNTLYFVANGAGGHSFSVTYQEHQKAVQHYRNQLTKKP
ncbi:endolytic transglycosylase MltG [Suttonella ornithocola]|uniref:Endolytic murein transglycosylase n=1 Tax=Suttonella ornithocola TaxID=279832 RepID=A0A380N0D7_9GAMM|nr:endolytic transglycosylase MltG [Suttonella ornithocola]SUO97954.1 putative aminodeoxychorismate lyase [Suttonella ornithocola]